MSNKIERQCTHIQGYHMKNYESKAQYDQYLCFLFLFVGIQPVCKGSIFDQQITEHRARQYDTEVFQKRKVIKPTNIRMKVPKCLCPAIGNIFSKPHAHKSQNYGGTKQQIVSCQQPKDRPKNSHICKYKDNNIAFRLVECVA